MERLPRCLSVAMIAACLAACDGGDATLDVLQHRQTYAVTLKSWVPGGGGIVAELQVVPTFRPTIETLTVRLVGFDAQGREVGSQRLPLRVRDLQPGLATVIRREVPLPRGLASVGVEVESMPAASVWAEMPELAGLSPPDGGRVPQR